VLVLAVLFASQIASTLVTGRYYAQAYTSVYDSNVAVLSQVVRKDLDKVLGYGVAIDHLKGCEEFLAQRLKGNPECSDMSVADSTGRILYHSGESGTAAATAGDLGKVVPDQMVLNLTPGSTPLAAGGLVWVRLAQGYLVLQINQKLITSHLTEQTMDSLTIAIVSLIMAFMLLELIRLRQSLELLAPSRRAEMMEEGKTGPRFIRLASFIFTFGAFVPLAFLPQHIQRIYQASPLQLFNWNSDIIVSVPIAMYMVGITVAMLLSMFVLKLLSLRHRYVIVSVLFIIGSILTVYARDILILSLARFVAGMGFGGALLATTSLVTAYTDERTRSTGFGISAAGFAAATLCSVPIGGVIVNRLGTGAGLYTAVIFGALFLAFILAFLRGEERGETVSPATVRRKLGFGQWLRILGSRHILTYTFFMNIPFQVLYWGLFQYVLPLYMSNSMGISEANIGRILSLFCIISLFAAFISRFADRLMNDKLFLATGGIVVGVALLLFNLIPGGGGIVVFIAVIAAMGVQNLVVDSIEEVYISKGKVPVEVDDETLLQSYKTMEKVLSVFVPTLSGLLILAAGFNVGMFIIGAYTLAGAVLFLVSAVNGRRKTVQEGVAK
jgi:predicted MFS family arabinose efflux permease